VEHVRYPDQQVIDGSGPDERVVQRLLDRTSGLTAAAINWIRTPPGGGSPEGLHVHDVDQIFYLLQGSMHIEVGGTTTVVRPGGLIVFPAHEPHRNWNEGDEPTVHLAINAPAPDPSVPFAKPVT
jgi:quercetin dioxygenase-like cupin family protein